ncbi:hypothetical protein [Tropicibacter alexandrii]|uniref:hypothetical protein n=1 Tax=Tropicibacter alexandrii TaxID=2267683 RepID=UPI0010089379|nr:hypothetical protein [Tropicibacter alexandrii]
MYITPDATFVMPRKISGARKVAKGRRNHFTGQMVLGTADDPCHLDFESHTEYMTCLCLIARMDVVAIENQVPCEWTKPDGNKATHYFDFRVSHDDGTRVAIMVKGSHRTESARLMGELETIAAEVPASFAEDVVLMTEDDLDPIDLHNAVMFHEMRQDEPIIDAAARRVLQTLQGAIRIQDFQHLVGFDGQGFRAIVRLLRCGELETIHHERIGENTLVRRSAN